MVLTDSGGGILIEFRIENVVASTDTRAKLNLQQIAKNFENSEYDPARFPGMIHHVNKPKSAIIFFNSGKLICTGINDIKSVHKTLTDAVESLKEQGVNVIPNPDIDIQNIVASADLQKVINLNNVAITLGREKVEYNPEQFRGLVYKSKNDSVNMILYDSGKIICTGARQIEEVESAINELIRDLESTGLMA